MDSDNTKKLLMEEKMNKLKILRKFAKNPTLSDPSRVIGPAEEALLLSQTTGKSRENDRAKVAS